MKTLKEIFSDHEGKVVKGAARHPVVEDDVIIYAGATILGRIVIGRGSTIGGNVWLTEDVPPNSFVTQATGDVLPATDAGGTLSAIGACHYDSALYVQRRAFSS